MTTQTVLKQEEGLDNIHSKESMFQMQVQQGKVERYVLTYIQNSEIARERKNENEMLKEDVGEMLGASIYPTVFELPDGKFAVVKVQERKSEKLDKEGLAQHIGVSIDELKTPYDFAKFVEKGIISADMIQGFMVEKTKLKVSIRKSSKNPLKAQKNKGKDYNYQNN